jgi:O-antigen ligase
MEYPDKVSVFQPARWNTLESSHEEHIGFPIFVSSLLITSYFYCLPIVHLGSLGTDLRLYDFAFAFFFLAVGLREWPRLRELQKDHSSFHYWGGLLLILVWLSLIVTLVTGGISQLLPALVRSVRFTSFFLAAGYLVILVDTAHRYRFILYTIYFNIIIQSALAFSQGMGWLHSFWPIFYGEIPVGTLSWHHKQIGVVMLMGIAITLSLLRTSKYPLSKLVLLLLLGPIVVVPIFSISRTAWLGFGALAIGYLLIHRRQAIGVSILAICGILALLWLTGGNVQDRMSADINLVLVDRYERLGYLGIVGERLAVYDNFPKAIQESPWILLIGTGFQNISEFISASGAHNNYAQAWFELGIFGFIIFIGFLIRILQNLNRTAEIVHSPLENALAKDAGAFFIAVLATMWVGETLWAQYSMYSLTGQIMTFFALTTSPFYWAKNKNSKAIIENTSSDH